MTKSNHSKAHITLVGGEKGGTGKTTLLVNLAAHRQKVTGNDILIVDTDRQGSASDWVTFRKRNDTGGIDFVQYKSPGTIRSKVPKASRKYEDIFIDAGGRDDQNLRAGIELADKMLIPVRASQFDIATVGDLIKNVTDYNPSLRPYVVVNLWKNHPALGEFNDAVRALSGVDGIQLVEFPVVDRIAFTRSAGEGRGVTETSPNSKAGTEIKKLYRKIYE